MSSKFIKKLKTRVVQWLLRDIEIEELKIGDRTITISGNSIIMPADSTIYAASGSYTIKNTKGLQVPVGANMYVP